MKPWITGEHIYPCVDCGEDALYLRAVDEKDARCSRCKEIHKSKVSKKWRNKQLKK